MSNFGRETVQIFAIDRIACALTYGESPCNAVLGVTGTRKCFNGVQSCQDLENFTPETVVDRFLMDQEGTLAHYAPFVPSIESLRVTRPLSINLAGMDDNASGLGTRERLTVRFRDHLHSDVGYDKYRLERPTGDASLVHSGMANPDSNTGEMTDFLVLAEDAAGEDDAYPTVWDLKTDKDGAVVRTAASQYLLRLVSGPGSVQERRVSAYDGGTKVATVSPRWRTNACLRSEEIDLSPWIDVNVAPVVTANDAVAPDGTTTADKVDDQSVAQRAGRGQSFAVLDDSLPHTFSVFIKKKASGDIAALFLQYLGGTFVNSEVRIDTETGQTFNADGRSTVAVQEDSGYWRLSAAFSNNGLLNTTFRAILMPAAAATLTGGGDVSLTGFQHFWGAQFEPDLGDYIKTEAAAITLPDATTGYEVREAYDPYKRGTHWGKWIARNPFYPNYSCRAYRGFLGDPLESMRVQHYILDTIDGPTDGMATLVAKDLFSKIEAKKAVAPFPSRGELSADLTGTPSGFSVTPAGIGDQPEEEGGYASIGDTDPRYLSIGEEIVHVSRTGDDFTFVNDTNGEQRGCLGTQVADHDAEDLVQGVFSAVSESPHDIAYRLLIDYAKIDPAKIDKALWDTRAAEIQDLYTGRVAKPEPVLKLVAEIMRQAGFTVWPDISTGMIDLVVLRAGTVSPTVDDFGWLVDGSIRVEPQPSRRVSQVWVYYGQRNPTGDLDDDRNYHSRVLRPDVPVVLDLEGDLKYGTPSIVRVFSRWIPKGGRQAAERCGDRIFAMGQNTPLEADIRLNVSRDGALKLARYFTLKTHDVQDEVGAPKPVTMATISIARGEFETAYVAQSVAFAEETEDGVRRLFIENDEFNLNLRTLHDAHFPAPVGGSNGEIVEFILLNGFTVGSTSTGSPAMRTGVWPDGVTLRLIVQAGGRVEGRGGNGGNAAELSAGGPGGVGGTALLAENEIAVDGGGDIFGGGGGGGAGGSANGRGGGGGGGGAGTDVGGAGLGATGGGGFTPGANGQPGTPDAGGSGGAGGCGLGICGGNGGAGGGPGLAGTAGAANVDAPIRAGGAGGAAGVAIDGVSLVTFDSNANLDIRGAQVN